MSGQTRFVSLLGNASFILLIAFVMGLVYPHASQWTKAALVPVLCLIMTLSVLSISSDIFLDLKSLPGPLVLSIVLNYLTLGGLTIGLSHLMVPDPELLQGFILVAAVPPAVAVIPYTYNLGGNVSFSLVGTVAAYLAALAITPLICFFLLGTSFLHPTKLLFVLVQLILAPLLVSRLLRKTPLLSALESHRGLIVNWGFFIIVYTIVGLNRDVFLGQPETLLRVSAVCFLCTFVLGELIARASRLIGVDEPSRISLILLGTRKNYGLASAVAVVFLGDRAAMPTTVGTAFAIIHFIWLSLWLKDKPPSSEN